MAMLFPLLFVINFPFCFKMSVFIALIKVMSSSMYMRIGNWRFLVPTGPFLLSVRKLPNHLFPDLTDFKKTHLDHSCNVQPISHRGNAINLLLYNPIENVQTIYIPQYHHFRPLRLKCHAIYKGVNHPCTLRIPLVRKRFQFDKLLPRTTASWNKQPRGCYPYLYNLHLFKFRTSPYLSYIYS